MKELKSASINLFQLSESQKKHLINCLRFSPTGDNSQHWKFSFKDCYLQVFLDEERGKHQLNIFNSASYLALGCLIETANVWAAINSFNVHYDWPEKAKFPLLLNLSFSTANTSSIFEEVDLYNRHTNRRHYSTSKLPENRLTQLKEINSDLNVEIHWKLKPSKKLKDLFQLGEYFIWKNRKAFMDTTDWVRFKPSESIQTRDGFSLENLNLSKIDGFFLRVIRTSHFMQKLIWFLGARIKIGFDTFRFKKHLGAVLAVSTQLKGPNALLESGRAIMRSWLYLNKNQISVHPLTVISLLPYIYIEYGAWPDGTPNEYADQIESSYEAWYEKFEIPSEHKITWAIRFGYAKPLQDAARTLRRQGEDFMLNKKN
ncbi:MAG: hypothetical protein CL674_04110 [Bdellovibrionaceae bacterium]|nr:hypothetical protein [Pseudobdellovibrionaceae bacterium]|tara:strand:+ start:25221 stop:26336 length:1116 start_codon:yes stop_codon:yes gene_type:complete